MLRHAPVLWGAFYDRSGAAAVSRMLKPLWVGRVGAHFRTALDRISPDGVVCTQAFAAMLVCEYRRCFGKRFPVVAVLTDFEAHRFWAESDADCFVVPGPRAAVTLAGRGVDPGRMRIIGIPVDPVFSKAPLEMSDRLRVELGLDPRLPNVLVSGGSRGFLPWEAILEALLASRREFQISLLLGDREPGAGLRRRLKGSGKPVRAWGYVEHIENYMKTADVFVTKPGGLACAEALACGRPTVLVSPLPGQEQRNAEALSGTPGVFLAHSPAETRPIVEKVLSSPAPAFSEKPGPGAALRIAREVLGMI